MSTTEMQSSEIGELIAALAIAQDGFEAVAKDNTANIPSSKGAFQYKYADLGSCIQAVRKSLGANGLVVLHTLIPGEKEVMLRTKLAHKSGQWIASDVPLLCDWNDPQKVGSALTYFRRYTLCAILQIPLEDDDGAAAVPPPRQNGHRDDRYPPRQAPAPAAKPAPASKPAPAPAATPYVPATGKDLFAWIQDQESGGRAALLVDVMEVGRTKKFPASMGEWSPDQVKFTWDLVSTWKE